MIATLKYAHIMKYAHVGNKFGIKKYSRMADVVNWIDAADDVLAVDICWWFLFWGWLFFYFILLMQIASMRQALL